MLDRADDLERARAPVGWARPTARRSPLGVSWSDAEAQRQRPARRCSATTPSSVHTRERSSPSLRSVPIASPLIPPCPWPLMLVSETRGSRSFHPVCPLPPPLTCLSRPFHPLWRCDGVACTQGRFGLTRRRSADGGRRPDVGDTTRERLASTLVPCAQKKPGSPTILPLGRPPSRFLGGFLSKGF